MAVFSNPSRNGLPYPRNLVTERLHGVWLARTEWDAENEAHHRRLHEEEFPSGVTAWRGANLRALRSRVIEDWLSAPWPAPRP